MSESNFKKGILIFIAFSTAFCSMIYELLIAQLIAQFTNQLITWQCISIGVYLGGLGLGSWRSDIEKEDQLDFLKQKFMTLEIHIAVLGSLLVSYICLIHLIYRSIVYQPLQSNSIEILFFTLFCQIINLAIGYFVGNEIPIITSIWKRIGVGAKPGEVNSNAVISIEVKPSNASPHEVKSNEVIPNENNTDEKYSYSKKISFVLGLSYFGTFCGSLIFSVFLFPKFHYVKTALITALINFNLAILFYISFRPLIRKRLILYCFSSALLILFMVPVTFQIYTFTIQNYYYGMRLTSMEYFPILINRILRSPPVEQIVTPIQTIDIVYSDPMIDVSFENHNPHIKPYHLYMDHRLQHSSLNEYAYHETMVHVPFQLVAQVPKSILVLGGGDGLLIREMLKYKEVEQITLVEIDSQFLELVNNHPLFYRLNQNSLSDPRVKVIHGDAYYFTRTTPEKFDAVFADFPWPFQYDLAKLYSKEFYLQLNKILNPRGLLVLDFPILDSIEGFNKYVDIMKSTLSAANFKQVLVMDLNKESFIFSQVEKNPLNFSYQKKEFDIKIPVEENLNELSKVYNQQKDHLGSLVNSIFKPVILNISDPRF